MTDIEVPAFTPNMRYTPRLQAILRAAENDAAARGTDTVGVEHVQLAILGDAHAIPTQVLAREENRIDRFATDLRAIMDSDGYRGIAPTPDAD